MMIGSLAFAATALSLAADPQPQFEQKPLLLTALMQRSYMLPFDPCSNTSQCVRLADKGLCEIQVPTNNRRELIITPVRPGESTVTIRDGHGDIRLTLDLIVSKVNLERLAKDLKEVLKVDEGIVVSIVGTSIHLTGRARTVEALVHLRTVLTDPQYKETVLNLALPSTGLLAAQAKFFAKRLRIEVAPLPPGSFTLSGVVASRESADELLVEAAKLARSQGFQAPPGAELIVSTLQIKPK